MQFVAQPGFSARGDLSRGEILARAAHQAGDAAVIEVPSRGSGWRWVVGGLARMPVGLS
jgi:hypothetical protein